MKTVVLGAGIAGLGAAFALHRAGHDFIVCEASPVPGGLLQTDIVDGFSFDTTGHVLHFRDRNIRALFSSLVPLERHERKSCVIVRDRVVPYPLQYNLWALGGVVTRAVMADLKRRHGCLHLPAVTLAEHVERTWGRTLTEIFFAPYLEKLWGRHLAELPADTVGKYVPPVDLEKMEKGLQGPNLGQGYNSTFFYPKSARLADVADRLAEEFRSAMHFNCPVGSVDTNSRVCRAVGSSLEYDTVIATAPLPSVLSMCGVHEEWRTRLDYTEIANVRVGFRGSLRCDYHWAYVPDPEVPFHRVGFPRNVNSKTCPPGTASLSIEYTLPKNSPRLSSQQIVAAAIELLSRIGWIDVREVLTVTERVISPAYAIQTPETQSVLGLIESELHSCNVFLAGRFGCWDYQSVEESFVSGVKSAEAAAAACGLRTCVGGVA